MSSDYDFGLKKQDFPLPIVVVEEWRFFFLALLLWLGANLAAGASDGSDRHCRRLRARAFTQSSDDGAFSSDDDDSDLDQLAEEEA